jgi:hypothetical protein
MFRKPRSEDLITGPSEAEMLQALAALRAQGSLCYLNLTTTNQGVAAEFSFNTVVVETSSGKLEIALKEAVIEIRSAHLDPSWAWNHQFLEVADSLTSEAELIHSSNNLASRARTSQLDSKLNARGKLKAIFGEVEIGSSLSAADKAEARSDVSRGENLKRAWEDPHIQVARDATRFRIEFTPGPFRDLIPLNTKIGRLPLLDLSEPASLNLDEVTATLFLNSDLQAGVVRHAFHIRQATGQWRVLAESPERRAVYELMLSKFLQPAHEPQLLWPHGERR